MSRRPAIWPGWKHTKHREALAIAPVARGLCLSFPMESWSLRAEVHGGPERPSFQIRITSVRELGLSDKDVSEGEMQVDPVTILMVEDDDGHATLIERNLKRSGIVNNIIRACDGQEACDYIWSQNHYAGKLRSHALVILLDINMPRMDGIEFLRKIKGDPTAKGIPVILLTTSDNPREIALCYDLGCSVYITKPVEANAFAEAIRRIGLLIQVVALPSNP